MTDIKRLLGANIREYRTQKGLTQEKLAAMAGMAANYLGLIESGKKFPSAEMIENIARALGRDPAELFAAGALRRDWQRSLLADMSAFLAARLELLNQEEAAPTQSSDPQPPCASV